MASPLITLNNGAKMPQVGFGLWKVDTKDASDIVYNAIKTGYRLFDGACGMLISLLFLSHPNIHRTGTLGTLS
jgi:D-xylose reductase